MKKWLMAMFIASSPAVATDCPDGVEKCKVLVITPEQEQTLKALIGQTAVQGPYNQIAATVDYWLQAIDKAPAGVPKAKK